MGMRRSNSRPADDPITPSPGVQAVRCGTAVATNNINSVQFPTPAPNDEMSHEPTAFTHIQDPDVDFMWQELGCELGTESISFLDGIFTQNFAVDTLSNSAFPMGVSQEYETSLRSSYDVSELDPSTLSEAIEAYFDLASLALPILYRDACMVDYKSHRASPALVYSIACRGCPFISTRQKWALQQQLANHFRQAFLEARLAAENERSSH